LSNVRKVRRLCEKSNFFRFSCRSFSSFAKLVTQLDQRASNFDDFGQFQRTLRVLTQSLRIADSRTGAYSATMIRAGRATDSFVAPTRSRLEFFNNRGYKQTWTAMLNEVLFSAHSGRRWRLRRRTAFDPPRAFLKICNCSSGRPGYFQSPRFAFFASFSSSSYRLLTACRAFAIPNTTISSARSRRPEMQVTTGILSSNSPIMW